MTFSIRSDYFYCHKSKRQILLYILVLSISNIVNKYDKVFKHTLKTLPCPPLKKKGFELKLISSLQGAITCGAKSTRGFFHLCLTLINQSIICFIKIHVRSGFDMNKTTIKSYKRQTYRLILTEA